MLLASDDVDAEPLVRVVVSEYEDETLPLSPEAGQSVENLERQSAAPHSVEDSAS